MVPEHSTILNANDSCLTIYSFGFLPLTSRYPAPHRHSPKAPRAQDSTGFCAHCSRLRTALAKCIKDIVPVHASMHVCKDEMQNMWRPLVVRNLDLLALARLDFPLHTQTHVPHVITVLVCLQGCFGWCSETVFLCPWCCPRNKTSKKVSCKVFEYASCFRLRQWLVQLGSGWRPPDLDVRESKILIWRETTI